MENLKLPIEAGNPVDDPRAFRRSLGQFATGVTVLTACHEGRLAGMAVNSFAALSLDPPLVLWSIRQQSGSLPVFAQASHFAVNVLSAEQSQLSSLFGSAEPDKYAQTAWIPGLGGSPLLRDCIATFECRREQLIEGGDHLIVVGRVERHARYEGDPLLFTQGRYAITQDLPGTAPVNGSHVEGSAQQPMPEFGQASWLRLLHYTSHELSACFDEHRQAEGLSVAAFRIYSWLRAGPHSLEQIQRLTHLGERDARDTLNELEVFGHLQQDPMGQYRLTDLGRNRADASARRVAAFEAGLERNLPAEEVSTTRRVLEHLALCAAGS
jgi:flavin reductase (DIM6/NTAB) family NADH-FMN oxidoreductase RutF